MGISLFERLTMAEEPQFLAMQYRMTPAISAFPSSRFYQGRLQDDASVLGSPTLLQHPSKDRSMPLIFWQTSLEGPGERVSHLRTVDNSAGSRLNETEAQQAVDLASALASACGPGVGILCWYRAQVARVEQLLREKSLSQLHVGSVATAQGSEWDYVILSTVRRGGASMQGRLGILADGHILNVALTRARRGLVVLGDSATLSTDPNWKAFLDHCRQQDVLVDSVPRLTSDEALWSDAWQRALVPGFKVELCQLQSQPELNGKIGTVCCSGENGRWEETRRLALKPKNLQMVKEPQLAPSPGATKGKPAFGGLNALVAAEQPRSGVEFSTTLRFAAQQLQPQVTRCGKEVTVVDRSSPCHGMKGIVRSRGGAGVSVEFSKSFCMQQGPVQVRPGQKGLEVSAQGSLEHLLKPGLATWHGLKSKPELNAEWARVVSEEPSEGRWEVDLLSARVARRLAMKPENLAPEL
ncbi:unnamed protein product [Durusdinium trenchii]|uniref:DNA2/NAM7 helicase-like C-terminal domain-containing protein n=1 Tax=Durusdinium trenchii TaxID=1381693 RepID=A0ABP0SN22_9DINO